MTAQKVYEHALALIDEINGDKRINVHTTATYAGKAPRLIDLLQRDLARLEGVAAAPVEDLADTLAISDDTALGILPYGLAALLLLADQDAEGSAAYRAEYERLKLGMPCAECDIADAYDVLSGMA